jgi:hypothetical protein
MDTKFSQNPLVKKKYVRPVEANFLNEELALLISRGHNYKLFHPQRISNHLVPQLATFQDVK